MINNFYLNECIEYIDKKGKRYPGTPKLGALKCIKWRKDILKSKRIKNRRKINNV